MPLYIVHFHTSTESIERQYQAPNAHDCIDIAEAHFHTWNADHGELHETVVCPPEGQEFFDDAEFDCDILEVYRLTAAGRQAIAALKEELGR